MEKYNTAYELMQDENIRLQCEAREDYYRRQRSVQHYIEEQAEQIAEKDSRIADQETELRLKDSIIAKNDADLKAKDSIIARNDADLKAKDSVIADLQAEIERLKQNLTTT